MPTAITEALVRSLSTKQSYDRGLALYRSEAIHDPRRQGDTLVAQCAGSSASYYDLRVKLGAHELDAADCSCPYDFGGLCKHLIALLLTYIHQPERFEEIPPVAEIVKDLDREALITLLDRLVEDHPHLQAHIELLALQMTPPAPGQRARATRPGLPEISDKAYRRQIRTILRGLDGYRASEAYWMVDGMVRQLDQLLDTAQNSLDRGDAGAAVVILMALAEEVGGEYADFDDSDGYLGDFLDSLGEPLAEAVLSLELTEAQRAALQKRLQAVLDKVADYGVDGLFAAQEALEVGWSAVVDLDDEDADGEDWGPSGLTAVKLNILERQGRTDEFLALCLAEGEYLRYCHKLIDLNRTDEALKAIHQHLTTPNDLLSVAQRFHRQGEPQTAVTLGERALKQPGDHFHLAAWLAPLAQAAGRTDLALAAYREQFSADPSLETYLKLRLLAGEAWSRLQPELHEQLRQPFHAPLLVDIYLEEKNWDAAIQLVEQAGGYAQERLPQVAEAVATLRPEWVITVSLAQADEYIAKGNARAYANAMSWLRLAKRAYAALGKVNEWRAHIRSLQQQYPRRKVLLAELTKL